jgi:hypothetical protein
MWLFDTLLYPVLTNTAVFALSVLATYETNKSFGNSFWKQRGDAARQGLTNLFGEKSKEAVKYGVMIFFSFADGCLLAPVVKLFEDRRNQISRKLDNWLGTTPANPAVYDQEPKQSWMSVLSGRAAAAATVVPTAVLLSQKWGGETSFNDRMFNQPGKHLGQWIEKSLPALRKAIPVRDLPTLMEVSVFEAFYTTVCTAGLYFASRLLASRWNQRSADKPSQATSHSLPRSAERPVGVTVANVRTAGLTPTATLPPQVASLPAFEATPHRPSAALPSGFQQALPAAAPTWISGAPLTASNPFVQSPTATPGWVALG